MNNKNNISESTMTEEQIELCKAFGLEGFAPVEEEILTSDLEEVKIEVIGENETKTITPKFVFKGRQNLSQKEPKERFELSKEDEELKQFLITPNKEFGVDEKTGKPLTPSRFLTRQRDPRVYIETVEETTGLSYGVFNGAGQRAITMYNPEHPDAPTDGPNYGKVFYRWSEERVVGLLHAIFDEYFEMAEEVEETKEE